jgi:hypothetical protein
MKCIFADKGWPHYRQEQDKKTLDKINKLISLLALFREP